MNLVSAPISHSVAEVERLTVNPFSVMLLPVVSVIYCALMFYLVFVAKSLGMASASIDLLLWPLMLYGAGVLVQLLLYHKDRQNGGLVNYAMVAAGGYLVHLSMALFYLWLEGLTLFVLCIFLISLSSSMAYLGFKFGALVSAVLGAGPILMGLSLYHFSNVPIEINDPSEPTLFAVVGLIMVITYAALNHINGRKRVEFRHVLRQQKQIHGQVLLRSQEILEQGAVLREANDQLKKMSMVDGLTDVANRRRLDDFIAVEWRRAETELIPGRRAQQKHNIEHSNLSIILIDIDHFKVFNDTYGHLRGDSVLKEVASAIQGATARPSDLTARYGGEEFVVVLPNTGPADAFQIAERIRKAVLGLNIENRASHTCPQVSVTLGVADMVSTHARDPKQIIEMSDVALYRAKQAGRNRTYIYNPNDDKLRP